MSLLFLFLTSFLKYMATFVLPTRFLFPLDHPSFLSFSLLLFCTPLLCNLLPSHTKSFPSIYLPNFLFETSINHVNTRSLFFPFTLFPVGLCFSFCAICRCPTQSHSPTFIFSSSFLKHFITFALDHSSFPSLCFLLFCASLFCVPP